MHFLVNHSALCKNLPYFHTNGKELDAEWKALVLDCIKKTTMLKKLGMINAKLSPAETSDVLRTIVNSDSFNTLETLCISWAANFSEYEACELMCTLI